MLLVSQDKEKVIWSGRAFNSLEYIKMEERGKNEQIRHTICYISDSYCDEVAEYKTKQRCIEVLKDICNAYKDEYVFEFPKE